MPAVINIAALMSTKITTAITNTDYTPVSRPTLRLISLFVLPMVLKISLSTSCEAEIQILPSSPPLFLDT